jgi:pilus assembly protein CpaB
MPGSFVDVVAVIVPANQTAAAKGPISKIVLQNIKVLASGAKIDSQGDQREPNTVNAVTLLVTPEEAEKLVLAANESKLQLVMRHYGDQEDTQTKGANKDSLLDGHSVTPLPGQSAEKPVESQTAPKAKPRIKRSNVVAQQESKPAPAPPPAPRNSIELIEGAKRRDVEIPND